MVVDKPAGILVHKTKISEDTIFLVPILEAQLGMKMYPIHRLDRATTGVLLFAKNSETAASLNSLFRNKTVQKTYLAIARGYIPEHGIIDAPLFSETKNIEQEALTHYSFLAKTEMPWTISRYPTSRYSLIQLSPKTGRHHQLRKHLAKIRHPIIGDRRHGDVKHNNFWRNKFNVNRLWLHASKLQFELEGRKYLFEAPLPDDFKEMLEILNLKHPAII